MSINGYDFLKKQYLSFLRHPRQLTLFIVFSTSTISGFSSRQRRKGR